ncbi:hypothetical protein E2562_016086 [Oryza meyeriana var. granulata]|uniref:Uncharacterized protein n=1 Tax=Oryza meyeriana var. granulata TaxID=110450 RepID=A0A6G1BKY7_9ORYZ|nr:hypothetical protein E2562_016086 [Oryza meyeriana var. granulata]
MAQRSAKVGDGAALGEGRQRRYPRHGRMGAAKVRSLARRRRRRGRRSRRGEEDEEGAELGDGDGDTRTATAWLQSMRRSSGTTEDGGGDFTIHESSRHRQDLCGL